jgi:pectin methylesterase-like acyl-CoA thioesterase
MRHRPSQQRVTPAIRWMGGWLPAPRALAWSLILLLELSAPAWARAPDLVVAADGSGDFTTIQGAIDAVPNGNPLLVVILIRPGTYFEQVHIPSSKPHLLLRGESRDGVIVEWDRSTFDSKGNWVAEKVVVCDAGIRTGNLARTALNGATTGLVLAVQAFASLSLFSVAPAGIEADAFAAVLRASPGAPPAVELASGSPSQPGRVALNA